MKEPKKGTGKLSEIRSKPGQSGAFKYEGTKAGKSYAGPNTHFQLATFLMLVMLLQELILPKTLI